MLNSAASKEAGKHAELYERKGLLSRVRGAEGLASYIAGMRGAADAATLAPRLRAELDAYSATAAAVTRTRTLTANLNRSPSPSPLPLPPAQEHDPREHHVRQAGGPRQHVRGADPPRHRAGRAARDGAAGAAIAARHNSKAYNPRQATPRCSTKIASTPSMEEVGCSPPSRPIWIDESV